MGSQAVSFSDGRTQAVRTNIFLGQDPPSDWLVSGGHSNVEMSSFFLPILGHLVCKKGRGIQSQGKKTTVNQDSKLPQSEKNLQQEKYTSVKDLNAEQCLVWGVRLLASDWTSLDPRPKH